VQDFRSAPRLLGSLVPSATGYAATGLEQRIHRGLPSPYLTFIFSLDGPVVAGETVEQAYGPDAQRHEVLVGGLVLRPAYVVQPERQAGVQLAVHPLAARAIFGMPAREIAVLAADGRDILGGEAGRVSEQLQEATDWGVRFELVRRYLLDRVADRRFGHPRDELVESWRWLAKRRGTGSMDDLASHVGLSSRQLRTVFDRELGLSPKQISRLMRFDEAKQLIATTVGRDCLDLTSVALQAGFYDHAHLDRDFVALTGTSPTGWLAEERRNIQAGGHGRAAEWEA
jgi:AraC-like DNA-binding protein